MGDLIATAKSFYSDGLSDPVRACENFLSQDFVLENYLPQHFPFGGRYEGASGFLQYLGEISSAIDMGPLQMDDGLLTEMLWLSGERKKAWSNPRVKNTP